MITGIRTFLRPYIIKVRLKYVKLLKLNSLQPVSSLFGYDRGVPIDRYYIENFLKENKVYIKGKVLEIADNTYTHLYGSKVEEAIALHYSQKVKETDIIGDLSNGKNIPEEEFDCFIMTQTLLCIFDVRQAIKNSLKLLKKDGVLLLTVPGITPIARYDMDQWGQYWSFTDLCIRKLFEEFVPAENIEVKTHGNCKVSKMFLSGLAVHEVKKSDLDYRDPDYQMLITARVIKA